MTILFFPFGNSVLPFNLKYFAFYFYVIFWEPSSCQWELNEGFQTKTIMPPVKACARNLLIKSQEGGRNFLIKSQEEESTGPTFCNLERPSATNWKYTSNRMCRAVFSDFLDFSIEFPSQLDLGRHDKVRREFDVYFSPMAFIYAPTILWNL